MAVCEVLWACIYLSIHFHMFNDVTGFVTKVYKATICPANKSDILERSTAINCTTNNPYICLPNKELTELLEMCHHEPLKGVSPGLCFYVDTFNNFSIGVHDCDHFLDGCPTTWHEPYSYPSCWKIENGCYLADPSCIRHTTCKTTQSNLTEENRSWTSREIAFGASTIFLIIIIIIIIIKAVAGRKRTPARGRNIQQPEEEEISELKPGHAEIETLIAPGSRALRSFSYAATEEMINIFRVLRLLMGPCTDQLRDLLRSYIPPASFPAAIQRERSGLHSLTKSQRELILPNYEVYSGTYDDMDISLLYILLRNLCGIQAHNKGWGNTPNPTDRSVSANIERLRLARNHCAISTGGMSNAEFNQVWSEIRAAVVDLDKAHGIRNKYQEAVDFILYDTMDPMLTKDRSTVTKTGSRALSSNPYAATEEMTNMYRVLRLLNGPCSDQLRDLLRFYIPPANFNAFIQTVESRLPRLTESQRKLILPNSGVYSGNYDDMDISLLYILLKTVYRIQAHNKGWGNAPDSGDRSVSANIERLRQARYRCLHSTWGMPNAEFNQVWSEIRAAVVDLDKAHGIRNKYQEAVDFIRNDAMDPVLTNT